MKVKVKLEIETVKNILLLIITVVLIIVVFEITLYLWYPQKLYNGFNPTHPDFVTYTEQDMLYGWSNKNNFSTQEYSPDNGVLLTYRHNSKGQRDDDEHEYENRFNKKRIVIIGDSFIYGIGIDQNETFPAQLQRTLGDTYELINLGVQGYDPVQEYYTLVKEGVLYKPDIIIISIFKNDFYDTTKPIIGWDPPTIKPTLRRRNNRLYILTTEEILHQIEKDKRIGKFKQKPEIQSPSGLNRFLLSESHLYVWLNEKVQRIHNAFVGPSENTVNVVASLNPYLKEVPQRVAVGYLIVELMLKKFQEVITKNNAKLILLYIPDKIEVDAEELEKFLRTYKKYFNENDFDFEKVNTFVREVASSNGIQLIDITSNFEELIKRGEKLYLSDDHWNAHSIGIAVNVTVPHILEATRTAHTQKDSPQSFAQR